MQFVDICPQIDDVQDLDTRLGLNSYRKVRFFKRMIQSVHKMKLQGSEQLQTVSVVYHQELNRDKVTPSFQRLRTDKEQHINEMFRTRNFKAWNDRIGGIIGQES